MDDELLMEREMVVDFPRKDGTMAKTIGIPVKLSRTPGAIRTPPDEFGERTHEILSELGYSREEIDNFQANDTI